LITDSRSVIKRVTPAGVPGSPSGYSPFPMWVMTAAGRLR
jgi:hypothetical protein